MMVEKQKPGTPSAARRISIGFISVAAALVLLTACSNMLTLNPNREPVVNITEAGGVTLYPGNSVTLDATESFDPDGQRLTAAWAVTTQPGSGDAVLTGADNFTPTFSAFRLGTYTLTLTVTDEYNVQRTGTATITVANNPPGATIAGGNRVGVTVGGEITDINGTGGEDDEQSPPRREEEWEYRWRVARQPWTADTTSPGISNTGWTPIDPATTPFQGGETPLDSFTPNIAGVYRLELQVRDEGLDAHWARQSTATMLVVTAGNVSPTLNAGAISSEPASGDGIEIVSNSATLITNSVDNRLRAEWFLRQRPDGLRVRVNNAGDFRAIANHALIIPRIDVVGGVIGSQLIDNLTLVPETGSLAFVEANDTGTVPGAPNNVEIELTVTDLVAPDSVFVYLNWTP